MADNDPCHTPSRCVGARRARIGLTFCTVMVLAISARAELIVNGDFEQGNTGFASTYAYSPGNIFPEGVYDIVTDPLLSHPGAGGSYGDHTTGKGNMMAVNGATTGGHVVWSQTVSVIPFTEYVFSLWSSNWSSIFGVTAHVSVSFNNSLTTSFDVAPMFGNWEQHATTWYSGEQTLLTIEIADQSIELGGNDFALDDISLRPTVPEPSTFALAAVAALGMAGAAIRRRRGANVPLS